jgi:hypothetical protein
VEEQPTISTVPGSTIFIALCAFLVSQWLSVFVTHDVNETNAAVAALPSKEV